MRLFEIKQEKEIEPYPIVVPPTDLEQCKQLIAKGMKDDGPFNYADENGKETQTDDVNDWVDHLPKEILRHEALHVLQDQQCPQISDGLPPLDYLDGVDWDDFDNSPNEKKKYMSRHTEIMAFAFDTVRGKDAEDNTRRYKVIGGEAEKLFKHYVREYSK